MKTWYSRYLAAHTPCDWFLLRHGAHDDRRVNAGWAIQEGPTVTYLDWTPAGTCSPQRDRAGQMSRSRIQVAREKIHSIDSGVRLCTKTYQVEAGNESSRALLLCRTRSIQALKLVKQIIAVDSSRLPREVVRTVVAVSGHKEDNFRRVGHTIFVSLGCRG